LQIVHNSENIPADLKGGVVAIGNFDGVHRGHRAVLDTAMAISISEKIPALVLTFEPHPRTWFSPENPVFRLTPSAMKSEILGKLGFAAMIEQRFDGEFASRKASEFIDQVLLADMVTKHVVTGYDFHFGKARQGTPDFLKTAGDNKGFGVTLVEAMSDENGDVISSSRIRSALAEGDIALANALFGYVFRVGGVVIKGRQKGRLLGFPTANLLLSGETKLAHGIYAVRLMRKNGNIHDGVASYGRRPTFDNGEALLETFIFDFSDDIYGEPVTVFLHSRLRDEVKFNSVDALVDQMNLDADEARALLSAIAPDQGVWPQYSGTENGH